MIASRPPQESKGIGHTLYLKPKQGKFEDSCVSTWFIYIE